MLVFTEAVKYLIEERQHDMKTAVFIGRNVPLSNYGKLATYSSRYPCHLAAGA
jgi:hypothetical protein